ncbi:hypothetical protein AB0L82_37795 [Nocardia sp. NPDC052001]|uniref:hypothetical protein n=1 Tax=Nocardia sp. NPDC052001 TaxID=3154853 RepID=UPI003426D657
MLSTVRDGQSLIKHSFDRRRSGLDGHTTPESTADRARSPLRNTARLTVSAALSQHGGTWPVDGRIVGVFATADSDLADLSATVAAIAAASMTPLVIAAHGGEFGSGAKQVAISRTLDTARSIEFDGLVIAGAVTDPRLYLLMQEAHRHLEAISYPPMAPMRLPRRAFRKSPSVSKPRPPSSGLSTRSRHCCPSIESGPESKNSRAEDCRIRSRRE